jgi:hypothetical protein
MRTAFVHAAPTSRTRPAVPARGRAMCWVALGLSLGFGAEVSGQVVRFGRTTDTIRVPLQTVLSDRATFEARIRIPVTGTPRGTIYHEQENAAEDKALYVGSNFSIAVGWTASGNYSGRQTFPGTPNTIVDGLWHHVAFVRDGSEERFYLDGVRVYSGVWMPLIANSGASGPLVIGAGQFDYYEGAPLISVDWLRLSNVARYAGASSPPPVCEPVSDAGTLALFLFNDAPGSVTVVDSGPSGANGTVAVGFSGATAPLFESDASQNGRPSFTEPVSRTGCLGGEASFTVAVVGPGVFTYRWRKDGVPINIVANPSAAAATLTVSDLGPGDLGGYDCVVTNVCGSVTSGTATLGLCPADFNGDCFLDFFDYDAFVACFETEVCGGNTADFNGDGFVDFFDYDDFVNAFEAGC